MLSSIYVIRGNISSHYPSDVGRFYHSQIIKSLFCLYEQNYQENSATATHEFSIFFIKGKFFISSLLTLPKVEPRFCVLNKNYDEESKKKIFLQKTLKYNLASVFTVLENIITLTQEL